MAECKTPGAPVTIPDYMLGASASVLTQEVVLSLAQDLEGHRVQLASQLGFSRDCLLSDGLSWWRQNPGSTVHVLSCILTNLNKADCLYRILEDMERNTMQLYIKLEYSVGDSHAPCRPQFQQVTTNTEFPLRDALWALLGGDLSCYRIMGPGPWVSWSTPAKELRGQQLTLLYHSANEDTELKKPAPAPFKSNISQHSQMSGYSCFRHATADHTMIEELKCLPLASIKSDSNNVTANSSIDRANFSIFANAPSSQTLSLSSVDNNIDDFSQDGPQRIKYPSSKENTDQKSQQCKTFRDKSFFPETNAQNINLLSQHTCNVPNFSMIDMEPCSGTFTRERNVVPERAAFEEKQNNLSFKGGIRADHCVFQNNLEAECDFDKWTMLSKANEGEAFKVQDMDNLEYSMDEIAGEQGGGDYMCEQSRQISDGDGVGSDYVTHSFIEKLSKMPVSKEHSPTCSLDPPQKKHRMNSVVEPQSTKVPLLWNSQQQEFLNMENQSRLDGMTGTTEHHAKTLGPAQTAPSNLYRYTPPPHLYDDERSPAFQDAMKPQSHYTPTDHSRVILSERQTQANVCGQPGEQHYMVMKQPHSLMQALTNSQEVALHHRREQSLPNVKVLPQHAPHQPVHLVAYRSKTGNPQFLSGTNSSGVFSYGTQGSSTEYNPDGIKYTSIAANGGHQTLHDTQGDLFQTRPLTHDALGRPMSLSAEASRRDELQGDRMNTTFRSDDELRYNYIDSAQVGVGSHSNHDSSKLQEDLARLEAWNPNLNGDMVLKEMKKYIKRDGVYVIWKSKRMNKFILTISHQQELIHLQINEANRGNEGIYYFLYENGFNSDRLFKLIEHYKQNGVRIAVPAVGGHRIHNENISLKYPLRV